MILPPPYNKNKLVNVIIETPAGSRNKYDYDERHGLFRLKKVLPSGMEFPCEMGFIPGTRGEDGDPLDMLVFMSEYTYPGCWVVCRLIGVLIAEQTRITGTKVRNDRFLGVPKAMKEYEHIHTIEDLGTERIDSIAAFFRNYNEKEHKKFRLLETRDAEAAHGIIRQHTR